jgi:hypothetical protein
LVDKVADCLLGDFGAASFYDINSALSHNIERVEVRAFACLLEDLLRLVNEMDNALRNQWEQLIADCTSSDVLLRSGFVEVLERLEKF